MSPPTDDPTTDDPTTDDGPNSTEAGRAWADALGRWGIPQRILDQAPESPWRHDTAMFRVDDTLERDTVPARLARDLLPPTGGSVLDVGCGGGRGAVVLAPPATRLLGVDHDARMLSAFTEAAAEVGVRSSTIEGQWPNVADEAPVADVVICHHVAYNVQAIEPFLRELTAHARLGVVLVLPDRHPQSAFNAAWKHFWDLDRPDRPTADDLAAVLAELGIDAERHDHDRPPLSSASADPTSRVPSLRRRLCLGGDVTDDEIAAYLAESEPDWTRCHVAFRWPGSPQFS